MYTLYYQHVVGVHLQLFAALLAGARLEVVVRQLNLFAAEECVELFVDELKVECVDAFIVVFAVLVLRCAVAVYKVVIERNLQGLDAVGKQLYRQALAGGGLARRRRSGKQHQLYILSGGNLVGNVRYLLFLQSLRHIYNVNGVPGAHCLVEVAHGANAQNILPRVLLLENLEHLVLLGELAQFVAVGARRYAQQHAVEIRLQSEQVDAPGVGEQ